MPREEVPYPCDCNECSTSQKLKTINGIEPNSGGNISILGDEGVTVKTDKDNHIVTFGIDTSTIDNVKHATSADSATKADTATKAGSATKANSADFAARANYAVQASMADYDTKGKTIMNIDGAQDVTGAKTFSGDQTFTGAIGASGAITATGAITSTNAANIIKVANHDTVLMSNDVLSAKDINTPNGDANNLLHRSGDESIYGLKTFEGNIDIQGFIVSKTNDAAVPSSNKLFQIEVDSTDGFTHYIAFNNNTDGSRSINLVMGNGKAVEGYFNLTKNADGTLAIYTNFPKPSNW